MLQNPNLPMHVRQPTEFQFQQTQMQIQQAQAFVALATEMSVAAAAANAAAQTQQQQQQQNLASDNQGFTPNQWQMPFSNQQPAGLDSAYQRLPVSNRRRSNKRDRPSDFLEIGGNNAGNGSEVKMARYWE